MIYKCDGSQLCSAGLGSAACTVYLWLQGAVLPFSSGPDIYSVSYLLIYGREHQNPEQSPPRSLPPPPPARGGGAAASPGIWFCCGCCVKLAKQLELYISLIALIWKKKKICCKCQTRARLQVPELI